ncbi:MAG: HD domain-containing protein [Bacteroidales bacterium]|nr:HD domain-containing protein [Bacteroidales bacterium]
MNKRKIINDPVYGFITISDDLIFDLIEHPYFQRLRNIQQLGLSHLVYPGALHTRFQHSLGAMHLMREALENLQYKGVEITKEEALAAQVAILLHDIGHGPFSHLLEKTFIVSMTHEDFTSLFMEELNRQFGGRLDQAIRIFEDRYPKHFLHQLVSGQLDVDRLDYLTRDSFFSGVAEGVVGTERIIKMLNVYHNELVADIKAIYSIEKFIISRRLMYWQVYLHKTVHVAEMMLVLCLQRAKVLWKRSEKLFLPEAMQVFFGQDFTVDDFCSRPELLKHYASLDDRDIWYCLKQWRTHSDRVLSELSERLYSRNLFRIEISEKPFEPNLVASVRKRLKEQLLYTEEEADFMFSSGKMENRAYNKQEDAILMLDKGRPCPLESLSDHLNHRMLSESVSKYFIAYPKELA